MVGSGRKIRVPFLFALAAYDLTCSPLSKRLVQAMPFLKQSVKYETASWVERFFRKPAHCKGDSRLDLPKSCIFPFLQHKCRRNREIYYNVWLLAELRFLQGSSVLHANTRVRTLEIGRIFLKKIFCYKKKPFVVS